MFLNFFVYRNFMNRNEIDDGSDYDLSIEESEEDDDTSSLDTNLHNEVDETELVQRIEKTMLELAPSFFQHYFINGKEGNYKICQVVGERNIPLLYTIRSLPSTGFKKRI